MVENFKVKIKANTQQLLLTLYVPYALFSRIHGVSMQGVY